jgi:hypothetical protein
MKLCLHNNRNIRLHNDIKNIKLNVKALVNKIVGQIFAITKGQLASKFLISFKSFSRQ